MNRGDVVEVDWPFCDLTPGDSLSSIGWETLAGGERLSFFRCTAVWLHFINILAAICLRQTSWQRAMQCNETSRLAAGWPGLSLRSPGRAFLLKRRPFSSFPSSRLGTYAARLRFDSNPLRIITRSLGSVAALLPGSIPWYDAPKGDSP